MRSLVALAAVTGALLCFACTNDYDAFLEAASEGGASSAETGATSGSDASSSTSASTSDASSASGSSSTNITASSSSTSAGGDGGTGGSGDGGAGQGGDGAGGSEAFPGADPCDGMELAIGDDIDALPDGWDFFDEGAANSSFEDGVFRTRFSNQGFSEGTLFLLIEDAAFADCSVTTYVVELPDTVEGATISGGFIGFWNDTEEEYVLQLGAYVDGYSASMRKAAVVTTTFGFGDEELETREISVASKIGLRIRAHDEDVSLDVVLDDGGWSELLTLPRSDFESFDELDFGAFRDSDGDNNDFDVGLSGLND